MRKKILKLVLMSMSVIILQSQLINAEIYGSISGKVITNKGIPVEGAEMVFNNFSINEMGNLEKMEREEVSINAITDKNGFYKIDGLPSGKYYLDLPIDLPSQYSLYKEKLPKMPIELQKGKNLVNVDIVISRYYGTISGKVFKSDGITTYPNVSVKIFTKDKSYFTVADSTGSFVFLKYKPDNSESKIMISSLDDKYDCISDTILDLSQASDITGLIIVAKEMPAAGFYGTVRYVNGAIISCGTVKFESLEWDLFYRVAEIKADGNFSVNGLKTGQYKIILSICPFAERKMTIDSIFTINHESDQKQLNLIYDENKAKTNKDENTLD